MAQYAEPTADPSLSQVVVSVTSEPASFCELPIEVVQQVLLSLPDVDSVLNASLSCWKVNGAFRGFEAQILEAVLSRELGGLSSLHPAAIEALKIPVNNNVARVLTKLSAFLPVLSDPTRPTPSRQRLLDYANAAKEIQSLMQNAAVQPVEDFDPTKGPYGAKRALEVGRLHQAHRILADTYFRPREMMARSHGWMEPPTREAFETALWRFESFSRVFGDQLWYERWGKSAYFDSMVKAYFESRTSAEIHEIAEVHSFLSRLVRRAMQRARASKEVAGLPSFPPKAPMGWSSIDGRVEGALSKGLVGILDFLHDDKASFRCEHPFFLGHFLLKWSSH